MTETKSYPDPRDLSDDETIKIMASALNCARNYVEEIRNLLLKNPPSPDQQLIRHGFSWFAAYAESLSATYLWARELQAQNSFSELEKLISWSFFAEYLLQLRHGIAMSQDEIIRRRTFWRKRICR